MKIVIAGAGDIGFHLAKLLSHEQQDITLIDTDSDVLEYANSHLDVITLLGDSASTSILEQAGVGSAKLFLAVTTSEKNNLVSSILAKKLGAKQTVARVSNPEYMQDDQKNIFHELGVDKLIAPSILAANEILRLVKQSDVTDYFDFEDGKLTLAGITLDDSSAIANLTLAEIESAYQGLYFKPISILRGDQTILPRPETIFRRKDHIYFLTQKEKIQEVLKITGKSPVKVRNIMILGGSDMGYQTAKLLENDFNLTIVEKDKNVCKRLVKKLRNTLIIKGDPSNIDILKEEGLARMDVFIALTPNSEINIITSVMAEECGVFKTIALVDNVDYTHISLNIGVDTIINKKLIAANNIFRYVRKGKIEAITSLHGVDAEVIEFVIQRKNQLTKKPIKDLRLPNNTIIAGVIRGAESIFPGGDFIMQPDDRVIVFSKYGDIEKVESLFR